MLFVNDLGRTLAKEPSEWRRTFSLHHSDRRLSIEQPRVDQFTKPFAKRRTVAEISSRHDEVVRRSPFELFGQFERDCLLAFYAKRIDRVDEIRRSVFDKLANRAHACVKRSEERRVGKECRSRWWAED